MGDRMPGYAYLNEIEDFLSFFKQLEAQQTWDFFSSKIPSKQ